MSDTRSIDQKKADLRRSMRDILAQVSFEHQKSWSELIVKHFKTHNVWIEGEGMVALFGGMRGEPDLRDLLPWLRDRGKDTAFFALSGDGLMHPRLVGDEADLVPGAFGVLTPDLSKCPRVGEEDLSTVLVPGLAFSIRDGARLGRGKGYYDRVLARLRPGARIIGVSFCNQMIDVVPRQSHDICMDSLMCETGWREIGG